MGENYIHINRITSSDKGDGHCKTCAEYEICITGMNRGTVVGVLSKLLDYMEIHPREILCYRALHDSSRDSDTGFKVSPELWEILDVLSAEGPSPSASGSYLSQRERQEEEEEDEA